MSKQEFLTQLANYLNRLSPAEREDILQDYEEHFAFALSEGKSENEVAEALGHPRQLAKEILATYHIDKLETSQSTGSVFRAVWSVIGLGFMNLVLVLGPFLVLVGFLLSGWIAGVSFIASPILVGISAMVQPSSFEWFDLFMSFIFCGVGYFICLGMYYVTIFLKNMLIRYLKYNVDVVKCGVTHG